MTAIESLLRPHVGAVPEYVTARSRYRGGVLLDANEKASGPVAPGLPPDVHRYPDPATGALRTRLAAWLEVPEDRLWFGNGSDEVIDLLIRLFVEPGDVVAVLEPSYGVYAQRAAAHGGTVRGVRLDPDWDLDVDAACDAARDATLMFLCSPNNPTGRRLSRKRILELLDRTSCVIAVDEAYIEFGGERGTGASLAGIAGGFRPGFDRLVVLRTFSKAWGLAGARVGYAVADPALVRAAGRIGLPYPLSSLAATAACMALDHVGNMERGTEETVAERARVAAALTGLGLRTLPSDANFLLFFVDRPHEVQERLAREHGVIIRDRSGMPGLAGALRVTVGTPEEDDRFLGALEEVLR